MKIAKNLRALEKGRDQTFLTPLAIYNDRIELLADWDTIYKEHKAGSRINSILHELELSNRSKFGPRSIAVPYKETHAGLLAYFNHQNPNFVSKIRLPLGGGFFMPLSPEETIFKLKPSTSSGLPFVRTKALILRQVIHNWSKLLDRKDPAMLFTRTAENRKTRNVWGYPVADTFYEMMFYVPLLREQKNKFYRAALVSPELVAARISSLIHKAMSSDRVLVSVDIEACDANIKYQHIIKAFDYIKSCFDSRFHPFLDEICLRMYTIGILTPMGVIYGFHGMPSGSTFTNEVDSLILLGIALINDFIFEDECLIQGDDGIYIMFRHQYDEFKANFKQQGLPLEESKSRVASNYALFCQNLYHIDYVDSNGLIGGVYPIYRALNRLIHHEAFIDLKKIGIKPRDYYNIRTVSILENCKHHPLFKVFVKYIMEKDKFLLEISNDGLEAYVKHITSNAEASKFTNHQYGSNIRGLRKFETSKLLESLRAEHVSNL